MALIVDIAGRLERTRHMNQSLIWLGVPMVMYALQGYFVYWEHGRYGMALTMLSYAQANIGLILDANGV